MGTGDLELAGFLGALKKPQLLSMQSCLCGWAGDYEGLVPLLEVLASGVQVWGGQALSQYQVNYKDRSVSSSLPAGVCHSVSRAFKMHIHSETLPRLSPQRRGFKPSSSQGRWLHSDLRKPFR